MKNRTARILFAGMILVLVMAGCKSSKPLLLTENRTVPVNYAGAVDTVDSSAMVVDSTGKLVQDPAKVAPVDSTNSATINWKKVFNDPYLAALIDSALENNQELKITLQELEIGKNDVRSRRGEYLPSLGLKLGAGLDKPGRYTRDGAVEENLEIKPGQPFPEPMGDFMIGGVFNWEVDIWGKLRNAKRSAVQKYLATGEGRNFMITNLVSEISSSYYELLALDNKLEIINSNIRIQSNALNIVRQQKDAAKVTQLAVNRFEAQLLNTQELQYEVQQKIVEAENKINFLVGRFPQHVDRNSASFNSVELDSLYVGVPSQLLENRADIRQSERELIASRFDMKSAKASFFPTVHISAAVGFQAFNPAVWFNPMSLLYNIFGDVLMPLVNYSQIKAAYNISRAKQNEAVIKYEQTVLKAYIEVYNNLSAIDKYTKGYNAKSKEAEILSQSVDISSNLFNSARADYVEVLLTQREALQAKMELIEIKLLQMNSKVMLYKSLGGGWR